MDDDLWITLAVNGGRATVMSFNHGCGAPVRDLELLPADEAVGARIHDQSPGPFLAVGVVDDATLLVESVLPVTRVGVRVAGGAGNVRVTVRDGAGNTEVPAALLMSLGRSDLDALAPRKDALGVVDIDGVARVCWLFEGGLDGYRRFRDWDRWLKALRRSLNQQEDDEHFVNIFGFVPLPDTVHRAEPAGHLALDGDRVSGWVDVAWTLRSDLLLPPEQHAEPVAGDVVVPGSGARGVLRSVHEVLVGGCLRVFDGDFVPSYREPLRRGQQPQPGRLAVVTQTDAVTGAATRVRVCVQTAWVPATLLRATVGPGLRSGSLVRLDATQSRQRHGRSEIVAPTAVTAGANWVALLTDAGARPAGHTYYAACGELGGAELSVRESAWRSFTRASAGSEDARQINGGHPPAGGNWREVRHDGTTIGWRRVADGTLDVGDVIWVRADGSEVVAIRLAAVWRQTPQTPSAAERLPTADLKACSDPALLCDCCAVFGSADSGKADPEGGSQSSYASHLRVGPLRLRSSAGSETLTLAPLGSPRPGYGGFYLTAPVTAQKGDAEGQPLTQWGSRADRPDRGLAGRKFYWHGQSPPPRRREEKRPHQAAGMGGQRRLLNAGSVLEGRVWFDALSLPALGMVLGAIVPELLLADVDTGERDHNGGTVLSAGRLAHHLGGGKPLGLGSATTALEHLEIWGRERYTGGPGRNRTAEELARLARRDRFGEGPVSPQWRALASLLTLGRVPPHRLSYPPGEPWPDGALTPVFDQSFRWYRSWAGGGLGTAGRLAVLPLPTEAAQGLAIEPGA